MEVKLSQYTPLSIAVTAIRTCWQSFKKGGQYSEPTDKIIQSDIDLIKRVVKKFKHGSTIEHLVYTFQVDGISRAVLQELVRHRIASYSVKSSRYTLKELRDEDPFNDFNNENDYKRAGKYVVWTNNTNVDTSTFYALEELRDNIKQGISNDIVKYCMPEAYKTSLVMTFNARSLQNFIMLRLNKSALWEIQLLAKKVFESLPKEHKFLYDDFMQEN